MKKRKPFTSSFYASSKLRNSTLPVILKMRAFLGEPMCNVNIHSELSSRIAIIEITNCAIIATFSYHINQLDLLKTPIDVSNEYKKILGEMY